MLWEDGPLKVSLDYYLDVYKRQGVTGVEEVKYAQEHGVDVILTDHHTFQDQKPAAFSTVHCNYPGQKYPFDDYCGAGVAYTCLLYTSRL